MTVLAAAYSAPDNRGTGYDEPVLMVLSYGKGRIFRTTLGHDIPALSCVAFITTLQRGTEWAATGKVTQKFPGSFPTAERYILILASLPRVPGSLLLAHGLLLIARKWLAIEYLAPIGS